MLLQQVEASGFISVHACSEVELFRGIGDAGTEVRQSGSVRVLEAEV
jgi:hypothetical protein